MKTKEPRDNIHMSWRVIDGFNKSINIFISPREPGKTDTTWWEKIYSNWYESKKPWVYLVRQVVEITDALISDIENTIINKWAIEPVELQYNKGDCKSGIVDVKIKGQLFIRIVALSIQLRRIKLAKIPNIAGIFMDEYIIDPKTQEKYLPNEYFKIKELYTTYRREYNGKGMLKMYFCGNPYSLYNPLFMGLGINVSQLKKDEYKSIDGEHKLIHHIYVGEEFAVEWGVLHPELKRMLLEKNPFYKFDEEYNNYALEGTAVNDKNIRLNQLPSNYSLKWLFRAEGKYIGIYQNHYIDNLCDMYFCKIEDSIGARRNVYCYDFSELVDRCAIVSREDREKFARFKRALQRNLVTFDTIAVYYIIIEIYNFI